MQSPGTFCRLALLAGLLLAWTALSCQSPGSTEDRFRWFEYARGGGLIANTVPTGAADVARAVPHPNGASEACDWEFETDWDQASYTQGVTGQLQTKFEVLKSSQSTLEFARDLGGDSESVRIEMIRKAEKLRARVTVQIYPD